MDLVRQLVALCMSHNVCFRAKHTPGKTNVVADHISRLQIDKARLVQPTLARDKVSLRIHWLPWGKHPQLLSIRGQFHSGYLRHRSGR